MTENHNAYATFFLGFRIALMAIGRDFSQEDYVKALECLDQIADGKVTTGDPSVDAKHWGGDGVGYRGVMNALTRGEKELAKAVSEDFHRRWVSRGL